VKRWCLLIALVACRSSETKQVPAVGSGSATVVAQHDASTPTVDRAMHEFCMRSMLQLKKCFDDQTFWDAHATAFFAARKQPVDAGEKAKWIGDYKDSFSTLVRGHELEDNCDTMIAQNQLPTPQQIELVDKARAQSCAAFGGTLGYVLFVEGAFYRSRGEPVPDALELTP
jgi:hypothetical protein